MVGDSITWRLWKASTHNAAGLYRQPQQRTSRRWHQRVRCYGDPTSRKVWCQGLHPVMLQALTGWPKLHLQVWSVDNNGRTDICGYGFMNMPTTPGIYDLECPLWVPEGSTCAPSLLPAMRNRCIGKVWPDLTNATKAAFAYSCGLSSMTHVQASPLD
jgi:Ciliary basal body-associated, B9 protein